MSIPEERQFSLAVTEQRILADLSALSLQPRTQVMGADPCCVWTGLHDHAGRFVSGGWGKGGPDAARVGALYEAAEHLLSQRHATDGAHVLEVEALLASLPEEEVTSLPAPLLADQLEETIACRSYVSLQGNAAFDYPLILSEPTYLNAPLDGDTFDYTGLSRYSANSGTAIGATVEEATLHALNECIERDAVSMFLLTHFFHARAAPLRVIPAQGLPADVAELYRRVSRVMDAPVFLLDISTSFGVTTCLALVQQPAAFGRHYGAGASMNPALAARRALSELLQGHLAQQCDAAGVHAPTDVADPSATLQRWPRLAAAARMDVEDRLATQEIILGRIDDHPHTDLAAQISATCRSLQAQGIRTRSRIVHRSATGTALVNVVVPQFERFFLVTVGNVLAPGARGRALSPDV